MNRPMKRASLNISIWALVLLASAACNGLEEPGLPQQGAGDYSFGLSVFCNGLQTKADKAGVDGYNENTLDYVDWFVFKSDTDTDDALVSGRGIPAGTDNTVATVCLDEWVPTLGRSYYVYTVANLPSTVAADHDALPTTLSGLKALSHTASFNHQDVFSVEGVQSSFIMRGGEDITFTDGNRGTVVPVSVPLERLAGKVSVRLNVAPAIDERETMPDGSMRYIQTWYPDVDNIEVYLSFANSTSTLEGTPVEYDMSKFFTYYRSGFEASIPATAPSWDNDQWEITGSPFYSYPMTWESESPQAPFLKVILKWKAYDESQGGTVNPVTETSDDGPRFVRHQRNQPAGFLKTDSDLPEFYYKIPLVPMSETGGTLNANDWLEINADLSILGSTSDDLPVIVGGQYYVTDWGTGVEASGDLKQASYLSLDRYTYEFYAQNEITIPVLSSHDITEAFDLSATYKDYSTSINVNTSAPADVNLPVSSYTITPNGGESITLHHELVTDLNSAAVDCARITFKFKLRNKAGIESQEITVVQYPPIYIEAESSRSGSVFIDGFPSAYNKSDYDSEFTSYNYHPLYDDGATTYNYTPTLNAGMTYTDPAGGVKIEFNDATNSGNYKNMANASSIVISVPDGSPYWLSKVEFTIRRIDNSNEPNTTSNDSTFVSYNWYNNWDSVNQKGVIKTFAASGNKKWWGEAKSLYVKFRTGNYQIRGITVRYTDKNLMGTIAHTDNTSANGSSTNVNMYIISVTDVSQMGFFVADTRSATPKTYPQLTAAAGGTNSALSGYYPLDIDPYNNNAIAPRFIVGSQRGGSWGSGMRFEAAEQRCASYQENGYPAGRWRLPTDAEIQFIVKLSTAGKIPTLFNGTFWGSSGVNGDANKIDVSGGVSTYSLVSNQPLASVRCVYPLWYWGDQRFDGTGGTANYMSTWSGWKNN